MKRSASKALFVFFILICCGSIFFYSCKKDKKPASTTPLTFTVSGSSAIGEALMFQSSAAGSNTYLWKFGNGDVSTSATPTYTFNKKGVYKVSLTINNSSDTFSNYTKTVYISIGVANLQAIANSWTWKGHYAFRSSGGILPDTSYDLADTSFAISIASDTSLTTWGNELKYFIPTGFTQSNRSLDFSIGPVGNANAFYQYLSYHYAVDSFFFTVNRPASGGFETLSYHTP